ncbi:MAG TPA: pilus assembly protein PilP [Gallionella sp.]
MMRPYFIIALLLLTGCAGGEFEDLREFVKNSGADMRGKIEPPPEVKPYEYFQYVNDENLPSPFEARKEELRAGGGDNQPDMDRPKEALEEYPLENLSMVGYLYRNKVGYAVIRAPDGKLHRVQPGNYMGLNFGLIKQVSDAEVVIREVVQDSAGLWTERMSSIHLQE